MVVVYAVFLIVFLVVFGSVYLLVLKPEVSERESIERRLFARARAAASMRRKSLLKTDDEVTAFPILDRLVAPWQALTAPLARRLEHADIRMTVGALLMLSMMSGIVAYAIGSVLFTPWWVAVGLAAFAMWVPFPVVSWKAQSRIRTFEEQFPEAIDLMSRALRAGHAFTVALQMVGDEAAQPVGGEFRKLYDAQNFGMALPDALRDFAGRIPLLDAKFFVTAVLTQRESGGNLSEVLDNLAKVIRERFKVKRQIRVISAHAKMTASVLIGLPPFLALAMIALNPTHMASLTGDQLGWVLIGLAAVLQLTGTLIIRKLVRIEY